MSELQVLCVKFDGDDAETRKLLEEAYKCLAEEKMSPVWSTEAQCLKVTEKRKNTIFILEKFSGDAYKHVADLGCRLYGPLCIITCLACKQNIPRRNRPIYNLAMKGIIVCLSNIQKTDREPLHEKVELMGGEVRKAFTEDVTHLVTGAVGSQKYLVAAQQNCQIMIPEWVNTVWTVSQHKPVHGLDSQFSELKCPIFLGLMITVSGLSSTERKEVKRLIEKEGGEYTGEMKVNSCSHLIINEPKGQKYIHAMKWQINVVRSEWLYESIEKGFCQDEKLFPVEAEDGGTQQGGGATGRDSSGGEMKTSTPERRSMAGGGLSNLTNISMISMANINETANVTDITRLDGEDPTENLDLTRQPADLFLDGCKIYLSGFRGATLEKLRKIINSGGGTRSNQVTDYLTHVIVGEKIPRDHEAVRALTTRPHMVTSQWLVDCFKQGEHLDEPGYTSCHAPQQPSTPEPKQKPKKARSSTVADLRPVPEKPAATDANEEEEMNDIMSQYLTNQGGNETTVQNDTTVAPADNTTAAGDDDMTQDPNDPSEDGEDDKVFRKRTFVLFGFGEENIPVLVQFIKENGGTVLPANTRKIPDYAVVPIDGFPVDRTVGNIVTNEWLQMCLEQSTLLDIESNPLFTPIEINLQSQPFKDCVISLSGYAGTQRDCLINIAEVLGAKCQDHFARVKQNGHIPSTHLIVNAPTGSKYTAAKKWGIPALSKLWILACAKSGKLEDTERFLIDNILDDNKMLPSQAIPSSSAAKAQPQTPSPGEGSNDRSKPASRVDQQLDNAECSSAKKSKLDSEMKVDVNNENDQMGNNSCNRSDKRETTRVSAGGQEVSKGGEGFTSSSAEIQAYLDNIKSQDEFTQVKEQEANHNTNREGMDGIDKDKRACAQSDSRHAENVGQGENINISGGSVDRTLTGESEVTKNTEATMKEMPVTGRKTYKVPNDDTPVLTRRTNQGASKETPISTRTGARLGSGVAGLEGSSRKRGGRPTNPALGRLMVEGGGPTDTPTTPLTRFFRNLEENPPPTGTPALSKTNAIEKITGKPWNKQTKNPISLDRGPETPAVYRFIKNLDTNPPPIGTPALSKQSAEERLKAMSPVFVDWNREEKLRKYADINTSQKENLQEVKANMNIDNQKVKNVPPGWKELTAHIDTPESERKSRAKQKQEDQEDEELVNRALQKAFVTVEKMRQERQAQRDQMSQGDCLSQYGEEEVRVLEGVVITVAKKNVHDQSELNDLVTSLGGDYRWNYDATCTHFIFQGRQNDRAKDFREAKSKGLKIVHPHWLYMCKEQNARVDESLFPHTFNPNLSLSVVATKQTPLRTPRSSRRNARPNKKTDIPQPNFHDTEQQEAPKDDGKSTGAKGSDSGDQEVQGDKSEKHQPAELLKSPEASSSEDDKKAAALLDTGGSLEMREALSKQLEDVMAESKGKKRRKSKRLNCSGQVGTPEDPPNSSANRSRRNNVTDSGQNKSSTTTEGKALEEKNSADMAPSQSVHVVWEDPIGRLEKEKLAQQLERANSPTQDVGAMYGMDPENAQYSESEDETEPPAVPQFVQQPHQTSTPGPGKTPTNKTPTPEGPSIAFPTSTKSRKVTPPKPVVIDDDDDVNDDEGNSTEEDQQAKAPPVFILSGMQPAERDTYAALVEQLGGKTVDCQQFDLTCTHLVINKVTRNEKFLASLASGKWVLHKSYFAACSEAGKFVKEDFYEWGNEGTMSLVHNLENNVKMLAVAARDWRIKIHEQRLRSPDHYGAFCDWRVILICDRGKQGSYTRLLTAGGATVLNLKPPFPAKVDATHVLLELHKVQVPQEDLEMLLSNGCLCLKPEYISGYLCNPATSVEEYIPQEIVALQTVMSASNSSSGRKRKSCATRGSEKRSKQR